MKRDLLYCSNVQHRHILKNMCDFEEKDPVLVCCQQMIEMLLKAILFSKSGQSSRSHSLKKLYRDLNLTDFKTYCSLLGELTDCYFTCRYDSDDYHDYSKEEFDDLVKESLALRNVLLQELDSQLLVKSNNF